MDHTLKMMMLGFAGVGKTSYLAALYKLLNSEGSNYGFWISADTNDEDSSFDHGAHADLLTLGTQIIENGVYPESTKKTVQYYFRLVHDRGGEVLRFNLIDYGGDFLLQKRNRNLHELVDQIAQADALMVFLDLSCFCSDSYDVVNQLRKIQSLIQIAFGEAQNRRLCISFVLSKCDLADEQAGDPHETAAWYCLNQLFGMLRENGNVSGLYSTTTVAKRCKNVCLPFFHIMHDGVKNKLSEKEKSLQEEQDLDPDDPLYDDLSVDVLSREIERLSSVLKVIELAIDESLAAHNGKVDNAEEEI